MEFTRCRQNTKVRKNLLALRSLASLLASQKFPRARNSHKSVPGGGGELAADEVGPGRGNKRHTRAIELTYGRLVCLVSTEMLPASGNGGAVAARPPWLNAWRGEGLC
jgi:hypothetical protein